MRSRAPDLTRRDPRVEASRALRVTARRRHAVWSMSLLSQLTLLDYQAALSLCAAAARSDSFGRQSRFACRLLLRRRRTTSKANKHSTHAANECYSETCGRRTDSKCTDWCDRKSTARGQHDERRMDARSAEAMPLAHPVPYAAHRRRASNMRYALLAGGGLLLLLACIAIWSREGGAASASQSLAARHSAAALTSYYAKGARSADGNSRSVSGHSKAPAPPPPVVADPGDPYSFPGMTPNESPDEYDFGITVDCGSKGSRLHIYKWKHRHSDSSIPPFSPVFTKHAWSMAVTPGISTFVDAPELVRPQLQQLVDFARTVLSEWRYKWNRTPLYLKATAGMRLIRNLPSRDRIMETIRSFLADPASNPFYFERTMARVISGEEEGVYGWMTANYLTGTLMRSSSATSWGALDMGGASAQITFRPPFDVLSNYFPLRLQQERIRLYTHSFLNFGIEIALARVNDRIIELGNSTSRLFNKAAEDPHSGLHPSTPLNAPSHASFYIGEQDGVRLFRHPCFPRGFSFTYEYVSSADLRASYAGLRLGLGEEEGADMSPITTWSEANARREMVQFQGSQDFNNCSALTWQLLHKRAPCFDNTCSFDGIYQPRFGNVTFLAFSEFSKVVLRDLQLPSNATLKQIDLRTRELCKLNWQQLQDTYRYALVSDLSRACFNARYVFTVLYKGFGFPYEGTNLRFVRNLLGLDLSWALGSMLYEANAMPWDIDPDACEHTRDPHHAHFGHGVRIHHEEDPYSTYVPDERREAEEQPPTSHQQQLHAEREEGDIRHKKRKRDNKKRRGGKDRENDAYEHADDKEEHSRPHEASSSPASHRSSHPASPPVHSAEWRRRQEELREAELDFMPPLSHPSVSPFHKPPSEAAYSPSSSPYSAPPPSRPPFDDPALTRPSDSPASGAAPASVRPESSTESGSAYVLPPPAPAPTASPFPHDAQLSPWAASVVWTVIGVRETQVPGADT